MNDLDGRLKEKEALKREAENWKNTYEKDAWANPHSGTPPSLPFFLRI